MLNIGRPNSLPWWRRQTLTKLWFSWKAVQGTDLGYRLWRLQVALVLKNPPATAGDRGSILGLGRSPGGEHGNPPQYSCLENLMDRGAWRATVHRVANSQTQPKQFSTHGVRSAQVFLLLSCVFNDLWHCSKIKFQLWGHVNTSDHL